jgi:hypothetical protein
MSRAVTVLAAGTMAWPAVDHWWTKGEAVGGVRRRGPRYMRPTRRVAAGLIKALRRWWGGEGETVWWRLVAVRGALVDEEQRALPPELCLTEGNLQCLRTGGGSAGGQRCTATSGKKGGLHRWRSRWRGARAMRRWLVGTRLARMVRHEAGYGGGGVVAQTEKARRSSS